MDRTATKRWWSAIISAFQQLVKQLLTETEIQLKHWREKLLAALGINGQVIIEVIPEIELIIGKQSPVPELGPTESQNRFNLVFQNFIRACCAKEHPLVIFIDDLQWADGATLKLIELMMTDTHLSHLFLLGAYRDNEVSVAHPLLLMLEELKKSDAIIHQMTLTNLRLADISQLLAETLNSDLATVNSLAELIFNKTAGNPFFVTQFLKTLYAEDLIQFAYEERKWQWHPAQIEAQNITANVVELMVGKLKKLPNATQSVLQLAACVGAHFDLPTLAIIAEQLPSVVFTELMTAVASGLILPTSELDENLFIPDYKFLHDRVQQAAYSLIPEDQKQATHLKIGQLLLNNSSEVKTEENLFALVEHLNRGQTLITSPSEREALARLNLKAGRKAEKATAYAAALVYLQTGIGLLEENCWQTQYELTLNFYIAATEAAYLNTDFDGMEKMAAQVLQNAQTILDKIKVYDIQIIARTTQSKMLEAIAVGREALGQLGVELPTEVDQTKINQALQTLANQLQGRRIEELIDLPVMTDPKTQAAMQLLGMLFVTALQGKPDLLPVLSITMVSLSLQFGNTPASTMGYGLHGMVLCSFFGEGKTGYDFGKLAVNLLERLNAREFKSTIADMFGACIQHYRESIQATLLTLKAGYQVGIETGNFLYAGYNISVYFTNSFSCGMELGTWESELMVYRTALTQIKQYSAQALFNLKHQAVKNFREIVSQPDCLIGTAYDETVMLPKHYQDNNFCAIAYVYIYKLQLAYYFGNYPVALNSLVQTIPHLKAVSGLTCVPIFHFYAALTHLALYPTKPINEQAEMLKNAEIHQITLYQLAQDAPMNYWHKWQLIEAEKQRVLGNKAEAIELYDQAIAGAKINQFLNEEALANELAAQFYFNWGKEKIAQDYWREAHYAYTLWGALAKVKDLEQKYPQFLTVTATPPRLKGTTVATRLSTGHDSGATLDLATVMKANQAISGEIVLDKLLAALMKIILQNAGAQTGYLILAHQGQLVIEASGMIDSEQIMGLQSIPLEDCQSLSQTIVNYVARTKQTVVLENATQTGNFTHDAYIKQQQPKSILCVPLINQGKLVSIVYLENNLATGAFTPDRLEVLNLISAQMAVSIENALLYKDLSQKNKMLHESEHRFRTLFESANDAILLIKQRKFVDCNPKTLEIFCCHREWIIGQPPEIVSPPIQPDGQDSATKAFHLLNATLAGQPQFFEWVHLREDGTSFDAEISLNKIEINEGVYVQVIIRDVSERKQAEANKIRLIQEQEEKQAAIRYSQEIETKNTELANTLQQLKKTQHQLVESEKMAALGHLVAGVAHEINTPVGIGVTAATQLDDTTIEFATLYKSGKMSRPDLERYLNTTHQTSALILKNLTRAAELTQSFKQVAVDQTSEQQRTVVLREYLNEVLVSLRPKLKNTGYQVTVNCEKTINYTTYPGAVSQILTNLIMNSLQHGFQGRCVPKKVTQSIGYER